MIIRLEHDGQPCLDSNSEKDVPLGIVLPQQSYYPEWSIHPALQHINTGYVSSISTGSDARSEVSDSHPYATPRRKRWRLFNSSLLFKKRPSDDLLLSPSTMVEKPRNRRKRRLSCAQLSRKWLIVWILLSLLVCLVVAFGVWIATKRAYRGVFLQPMNSEWSPKDSNIYTFPPELFGCYSEPSSSILNVSHDLISIPLGQTVQHTFTIQGGASGQLSLASSPDPDALEITYDIVVQSNLPLPTDTVSYNHPPPGPSNNFLIDTPITTVQPSPRNPPACMRFDITMYIPRSLRRLTVNVSTPVQITFSPQAHIELDQLTILITNSHPKSRIDSSESVQAKSISVEMYTGLIQGLLSLGESSKITNWNGQIQLDTIPNVSMDFSRPSTALLETISYGKVEIRYLRNKAYRRRPIESRHTMGTNDSSIGRFDYGCSGFNGLLYSNSSRYNITNGTFWRAKRVDTFEESPWPIITGNRTGEDKIYITSGSGWIVLPDNSHI